MPNRKNFTPLLSRELPYYAELKLNLPPVLEVLEWADRQQFDVIHCSTPGPMGLCGWLVAKMLRVPLLGTYHTDFPAYVDRLTRDHRVTNGTVAYMKWFYAEMAGVFSRSKAYRFNLRDLGVAEERLLSLPPSVNIEKFNPELRDASVWSDYGVTQPRKLLYCGRVSVEKNLPMLVEAFKKLCAVRNDTALVIAGDGPYLPKMKAGAEPPAGLLPRLPQRRPARAAVRRQRPVRLPLPHRHARPGRHGSPGVRPAGDRQQRRRTQGNGRRRSHRARPPRGQPRPLVPGHRRPAQRRRPAPAHGRARLRGG